MCGIAGILGNNSNQDSLKQMLLAQCHRGPDALDFFCDNNVSLGHNRLSIIDLSSDANQPMKDSSGRYVLVFNGEIYNYIELKKELSSFFKFKTNSDSEVLLYAYIKWGSNVLNKLKGMFAFAIWDNVQKQLFAARDRFGVKPLYYTFFNKTLVFASESNSIFASGLVEKKFNESVWSSYFSNGSYGLPNETFYESISQLEPGHYMTFSNGKIKVVRWYDFVENVNKIKKNEVYSHDDLEEKISYLLNQAITLRFRSDVPVGFNLSGGLDSSLLLGLIKNQNFEQSKINAFTFYTNDNRYDELYWVEKMVSGTNFNLHKCLLSVNDIPDLAYKTAKIQAEPFGGIPTIAYGEVFKKASQIGVKVLLDGQGSDEAWAGYDYYTNNSNSTIQGVTKSPFRHNVLEADFISKADKFTYAKPFTDDLLNLQYRDLFYTKIPRALRFNDRMSMMYGTELREPFLDHELVEFVFAQPTSFKINDGIQKWFLRKLAAKYLCGEITTAPKRPLQTPQREWLSYDLKDWVVDEVNKLNNNSWFNKKELHKELANFFKGDNQSSFHIWQWMSLTLLNK
jgi:asparagine synthase (glutamine-hydrolysing)